MKPLSDVMANALRRMLAAEPKWVLAGTIITQGTRRALRTRGLSSDGYALTDSGRRLAKALGGVPTDPWGGRIVAREWCPNCGTYVDPALIAWDEYDGAPDASPPICINCLANRKGYP